MSNANKVEQVLNPLLNKLVKETETEISYDNKQKIIQRHNIDQKLKEIERQKEELERISKIDIMNLPDSYFTKMDEEQDRMIQSLKNRMPFINGPLTDFVPFSYPNLLLVGAETGSGKSTAAANIVYSLLKGDKREDGTGRKVLVISNEEMAVHVLNRIICLEEGWNYNNLKDFKTDQLNVLKEKRRILSANGRIRVIDSEFDGYKDATSTIEGLKVLLESAYNHYKETGDHYDAIVIDYFQKIDTSKENPRLDSWRVLIDVSNYLDNFYKRYPAPIVVFSQIKPESKDDSYFENRIKLCKNIAVVCTHALEIKRNIKMSESTFTCHKHRFSGDMVGTSVITHWDRGRFIPYSDEFKMKIVQRNSEREHQKLLEGISFGNKG